MEGGPPLRRRALPPSLPPPGPSPAAARLFGELPMKAPRRRAAAGEVFLGRQASIRAYCHEMRFALHIYQLLPLLFWATGLSHCPPFPSTLQILLFKAVCQTHIRAGVPKFYQTTAPVRHLPKTHPPPKEIPRRRSPGIPYLQYRMHGWGPVPGKGLAGGGLEGLASP